MSRLLDSAAEERLRAYFDRIGDVLGDHRRRESYAIYAQGVLSDLERKSIEPIAVRACGDPEKADAAHQRLLHFTVDSRWDDQEVRRTAADYALQYMTLEQPISAWIVDDTGFLKQGRHSVGVQRQYTGSAGKITNCQVAVSLTLANATDQLPVDFDLYLPERWMEDAARRKLARIPQDLTFRTKPQIALAQIKRALANGYPPAPILADAAYGSSRDFRQGIRALGLDYAVAVNSTTSVSVVGKHGVVGEERVSLSELAQRLHEEGRFRRRTWRQGTKQDLSARFAFCRVAPVHDGPRRGRRPETVYLLIEWRDGEDEPANFFFSSIRHISMKRLIDLVMQRWRVERAYQDLKDELGLDHYEGRRYPGWHHHISVVLSCYAFIVAERVRRFPPSATGPRPDHQVRRAA